MNRRILVGKFIANPVLIFLLDGLGALSTAFFLYVILARFESVFGVPPNVLYILALIAVVYAFYSLGCYIFLSQSWRPFLRTIFLANMAYCFLTTGLIGYGCPHLTGWGLLYFLLEMLVIVGLLRIEWLVLRYGTDRKV